MNRNKVWEIIKKGKQILSFLCVIGLFVVGLRYCSRVLVNKTSIKKYEQFFHTDKRFDVLFLGSSHVINGVSPLDLFRDYGIASFNLSQHGNYVRSAYYLLAQILEIIESENRDMPKVVVLDVYADGESVPSLHNAWDGFPSSEIKRDMARNLANDKQTEMVLPLSLYHSRWNELAKQDFNPTINQLYGAELRYGVSLPGAEIITDPEEKGDIDEEKRLYVDRIKELCSSFGIRLVLINIPYSYKPEWQREANAFYDYAQENQLCYINYMNEDIGIDFDIDLFDTGHLNPAGMRKITHELGKLLQGMEVEDRRDGDQAEQWMEEYGDFIQFRINKLKQISQAAIYLMSINDPDLFSVVQIKRSALENVQIRKLIQRLKEGENQVEIVEEGQKLTPLDGKEGEFDIYCTVYEKGNQDSPADSRGFVHQESYVEK